MIQPDLKNSFTHFLCLHVGNSRSDIDIFFSQTLDVITWFTEVQFVSDYSVVLYFYVYEQSSSL